MLMIINKLVRDKIPEIIQKSGGIPVIETASDENYRKLLHHKLREEVEEYIESKEIEEVADILEIIYALADQHNISIDELEKIRNDKVKKNGAFKKKIVLIEVKNNAER